MIQVSLHGKEPIYEQLYAEIKRLISVGAMLPNEKLPAVREVAKSLGINPNTVQKTYALLEQAGLIYSIPAKGSYVSNDSNTAKAIHDEALKKLEGNMKEAFSAGVTKEEMEELLMRIVKQEGGK